MASLRMMVFDLGYGLSSVKSGGSTRLIEINKRLNSEKIRQTFITTSAGRELYSREGVSGSFYCLKTCLFINKEYFKLQRAISYLYSLIDFLLKYKSLPNADVYYSSSDFVCDTLPSVFMKFKNADSKYFAFIHHQCAPPHVRKGSFFVNSISYISQRLSFLLIKRFADKIFLYETAEGKKIASMFEGRNISINFVANGIELQRIRNISPSLSSSFDACFAGGLRETKGITDIVKIWAIVVKCHPNAKLCILGSGSLDTTRKIETL